MVMGVAERRRVGAAVGKDGGTAGEDVGTAAAEEEQPEASLSKQGSGNGSDMGGNGSGEWVKRWRHNLVKFQAAPEYLKDNEFILQYYRAGCTLKQTFLSIFTIHNETLNIWTHLLGFFLFLGLTIYTAIKLPRVAESGRQQLSRLQALSWETVDDFADIVVPRPNHAITRWPFFVYLVGVMFCLLSSSTCHLLMSYSKSLCSIMLRVDYAGIAFLIASSFYPPVYYTFLCTPIFCNVYLVGITVLGVATVLISLIPAFEKVEYRPARALLFVSMGMSGVFPMVHKLRDHWHEPYAIRTFFLELTMGACYGLGALIYTTRVPERWMPGKFDLAGASHQIFHVLVVAGALTHYRAALVYLHWRDVQGCPSS